MGNISRSYYGKGVLVAIGGDSRLTRRLSSVSRTATPASTLPTVREISIVASACVKSCCNEFLNTFGSCIC